MTSSRNLELQKRQECVGRKGLVVNDEREIPLDRFVGVGVDEEGVVRLVVAGMFWICRGKETGVLCLCLCIQSLAIEHRIQITVDQVRSLGGEGVELRDWDDVVVVLDLIVVIPEICVPVVRRGVEKSLTHALDVLANACDDELRWVRQTQHLLDNGACHEETLVGLDQPGWDSGGIRSQHLLERRFRWKVCLARLEHVERYSSVPDESTLLSVQADPRVGVLGKELSCSSDHSRVHKHGQQGPDAGLGLFGKLRQSDEVVGVLSIQCALIEVEEKGRGRCGALASVEC